MLEPLSSRGEQSLTFHIPLIYSYCLFVLSSGAPKGASTLSCRRCTSPCLSPFQLL